ncbi:hypothetical protein, partial [Staphylococcus saprophyticus]|uniref:hypothetical protein n=1 Tax=Staphylococcus saprophyticus TaxID=29385 RepID=UPI001E3B5859
STLQQNLNPRLKLVANSKESLKSLIKRNILLVTDSKTQSPFMKKLVHNLIKNIKTKFINM